MCSFWERDNLISLRHWLEPGLLCQRRYPPAECSQNSNPCCIRSLLGTARSSGCARGLSRAVTATGTFGILVDEEKHTTHTITHSKQGENIPWHPAEGICNHGPGLLVILTHFWYSQFPWRQRNFMWNVAYWLYRILGKHKIYLVFSGTTCILEF